jgi:hypothetical protein
VPTPSPIVTSFAVSSPVLTVPFPSIAAGYSGQLVANGIVLNSAVTAMQSSLSLGTPPVLSQATLAPKPVSAYTGNGTTSPVVLSYAELTPSSDLQVNGAVTLTFTYPPGTLNPALPYYYAFWFGQLSGVSWIDGNPTTTVDFTTQTITITGTPAASSFNQFRGGYIYGFAIYHY